MSPLRLLLALGLCALPACGGGSEPSGSATGPTTAAATATVVAGSTGATPTGAPTSVAAPSPTGQDPVLAPNAPVDKPVSATGAKMAEIRKGMAPHIEEARRTYPDAKKRYLAGLPRGEHFFVTTVLHDDEGTSEQVFVAVSAIQGGKVTGKIASDILTVKGFKRGEACSVPEPDLIDWLISKPDGSEEGNFVGKYLDTVH